MRFMAVFIQLDTCHAVGFEDLTDAIDFLFWGYEEHDLLPCGTYDLLTGKTAAYEHRGRFVGLYDPDLIRQTATEYMRASLRLMSRSPRQNGTSPGQVL